MENKDKNSALIAKNQYGEETPSFDVSQLTREQLESELLQALKQNENLSNILARTHKSSSIYSTLLIAVVSATLSWNLWAWLLHTR